MHCTKFLHSYNTESLGYSYNGNQWRSGATYLKKKTKKNNNKKSSTSYFELLEEIKVTDAISKPSDTKFLKYLFDYRLLNNFHFLVLVNNDSDLSKNTFAAKTIF